MKRKLYVIRVVMENKDIQNFPIGFLDSLRYNGNIIVHENQVSRLADNYIFDMIPPLGSSNTEAWATMGAERMRSFGIHAHATNEDLENDVVTWNNDINRYAGNA